jgi:hypothetical protein
VIQLQFVEKQYLLLFGLNSVISLPFEKVIKDEHRYMDSDATIISVSRCEMRKLCYNTMHVLLDLQVLRYGYLAVN